MNSKLGRVPFIAVWFYAAMAVLVSWQEYYTPIIFRDFETLVIVRLVLVVSIIPTAFVLRKNPFSIWANSFVCLNFLVYNCAGLFYRPMYGMSFVQTLLGLSFLFFTTRSLYFWLSTLKTILFLAFYLLTYDLVKYRQGSEEKLDFICAIVVTYWLSLLIHHFFSAERGMKEAANDRFALLGRHAGNIVHDIKGSISIPQLYLNEIHKSLENKDYQQVREYLSKMESSLSRTEKTIFDLNQLSRMTEGDNKPFKVSEGFSDVLDILAKRLHDIEVKVDGDFEIQGDRGITCSIFLNIILNALESFKRSQTQNPKIEIKINPNSRMISFIDNGGGFSKEALSSLKGNQVLSSTTSNSGLGLYLVRENLRTLKGRVSFQNIESDLASKKRTPDLCGC
jgi:signal transduction histidine kinase